MDSVFFWIIISVVIATMWSRQPKPGDGCPSCGAKNRRVARFCRKCGVRLISGSGDSK
ncbi:MAG: zinc-ribbon domain-containing protein [Planctomycetes bacterium]|nr:zinc-ribbon domain-containing protein [Planctomycetota bacterium]